MGKQPLDPVSSFRWHKRKTAYILCSLSAIALSWSLGLHEIYKNDQFSPYLLKKISSQETACYAQVKLKL